MAKQYKIKRRTRRKGTYKAAPHPLSVLLSIVGIALLVYVGIVIYEPVYNFIMNIGSESEQDVSGPEEVPSLPEESPPPAPSSEPEEPAPPEAVRDLAVVYMPMAAALDPAATERFLDALPQGANAVLVDVKDSQGRVLYQTRNPSATAWEAVAESAVDLEALAAALKARNLHLVTRMHTFSDPVCARGDRAANAVKYQGSEMLWLDNYADMGGKPWSNPYAPQVRAYLTELAAEMAELGAAMVILDGARFPDDTTGSATYGPGAQGVGRGEALKAFVDQVRAALEPLGARVAVQVPATGVGHLFRDNRYGGNPLSMAGADVVLTILPEELAEGYLAEGVSVTRPALDPAATVGEVLAYARGNAPEGQNLIPLLRGGAAGTPVLTPEQIQNQLAAARDSGASDYVLYAADGVYAGAAAAPVN